MNFEELNKKVIDWANEKGISFSENSKAQLLKANAELGELSDAEIKNDQAEIIDGIGDVLVTIIIYAHQRGYNPVRCLESAYNIISKRKGKTVNGTFIKEEDF